MIKTCTRCSREFESTHFAKYCPPCRDEAAEEKRRQYYDLHSEQIRARERRRYWANPELYRARARQRRATEDINND